MFGKQPKSTTGLKLANSVLFIIDSFIRDYEKGKLSADDLGVIIANLKKDVIEARMGIRKAL